MGVRAAVAGSWWWLAAGGWVLAAGCSGVRVERRSPDQQAPHDQHIFAGGIAPAGDTSLRNPFARQPKLVLEGRQLFNAMNCDGCHASGEGSEGPSLSDGRWRYGGTDAAVFQSIHAGRPRGMPAYGGVLTPDGVWRIVTYLRSLPLPKAVPTQAW